MQTILHNCCGLDVHKDSVVACILKTNNLSSDNSHNDEVEKAIRSFETFPDALNELKQWLESEDCHHVAMESTGVYWYPVYFTLEKAFDGAIDLLVTNARHMRNVPGKKTDMKDAEWIASLLRAGLLQGSFIPPENVRELRDLTRYRKNKVFDINTQKNRIEKALQSAGIKLSTFLTDVFGVSGRNLIDVLIEKGYITENDVEMLTKSISAEKKIALKRILNIQLTTHQRNFLKMLVNHLDEQLAHLKTIEASIEELSTPFEAEIERLDTIPGIATTAATAIIAEVGTDMSKFPTAEHFCSWAGLSPGDNVSAGKKKSTRITHGNPYIKSLLCDCAWSATRKRETFLSKFYWKLKPRRGSKKAIIAVARKMLVIIYHILKNKETYNEDKFEKSRQKQDEIRIKRITSEARKLGYIVMKEMVA